MNLSFFRSFVTFSAFLSKIELNEFGYFIDKINTNFIIFLRQTVNNDNV